MDLCVLADPMGRVQLDYPYLAAVTGWPAEVLVDKLSELTRPEPSSGSQKEEGAPLMRAPWGWQIVNYAYYRNLRPRNDERRKAYRRTWMRNKRQKLRELREPREPGSQREQSVNKREHSREQGVNTEPERHAVNGCKPNELQQPCEQAVNSHEHLREQSVNPNKSREVRLEEKSSSQPVKPVESHPPKRNGLVDSEWLARLKNDSAYFGINVSREFGKMANWCRVKHKLPTRARFVNWLNRIEVISTAAGEPEEEGPLPDPPDWRAFFQWRYNPEVVLPESFMQMRPDDQREYERGYSAFLQEVKK